VNRAEAWQAAAILALLVIVEGVRRLAPGTVVLRRILWSRWRMARPSRLGVAFHLVSWLVPLSLPLVLPPRDADVSLPASSDDALASMRAAKQRAGSAMRLLQINGSLIALMLVVVLPYVSWWRGAFGLRAAVCGLLLLTVVQASVARLALRGTGLARLPFARYLWPFTALRAAEHVQERIVAAVPPLLVMRELLGDDELVESHRERLHDWVRSAATEDEEPIVALVGRERVQAFLARVPSGLGPDGYCPRCASRYRPTMRECGSCGVVLAHSTE
jgi:hypothetical protein